MGDPITESTSLLIEMTTTHYSKNKAEQSKISKMCIRETPDYIQRISNETDS